MKDYGNDISQELLEAIERHINGTMTLKERKDFDEYLKIDSNFRTMVEDVKTMLTGIEKQSFKEELEGFHQNIENAKKKKENYKKIQFLKHSKIAAAIAILIAIGSIWFFSRLPNQRLYVKYFTPDSGLPTTMSSTKNFDFYDAMVNYKHGDYQKAIKKWEVLIEQQPKNDTLSYFLGLAYMSNKNVIKAIPYLERTVQSQDSFPFLNKAYQYLGLAYLKESNADLAEKYLHLSNTDVSKKIILELND